MKYENKRARLSAFICALLALTLAVPTATARPLRVGATGATPGVGIGSSDGDRDGDGMIEGPVTDGKTPAEQIASDIGDSVSRGMEDIREGASELSSGMTGEATEGTGRGPVETDPGTVKDGGEAKTKDAARETADTVWVIVAVIAAVAVVAAIVIAVPRKGKKSD